MDTDKINQKITINTYGADENDNPFPPNPTQQRILDWYDAVRSGKKTTKGIPVLYLRGGVGSGKSRGVMAVAIEALMTIPGIRVLWGRQDFKDLKLSIMDKFFEILPNDAVLSKSEQYHWYDIKTTNKNIKSRIYFNGLKDLSGFGSQEFAIVIITEAHETTEMAYRTLKRRCRQAKMPVMIFMESEPPNEGHWLERLTNPAYDEYDPDIEMWELSTYENWDNLPESYRISLESMPKAWQRKYLYGKAGFIPDGRPFYEGFREEIHAGDYTYNKNKTLSRSWDFGFHHPALTVHQIDDSGRWFVLAELLGNEITIDKFCEQVKIFLNTRFPDHQYWEDFGDPACLQHNDKSEKTSWQICNEYGFKLQCHQSTYRMRKEIIDGRLSKMINGKPLMCVDKSCKILIDGLLGGYHYPERKPDQKNSETFESPYPDGYYEHICNTVEYYAIHKFKVIEKPSNDMFKYRNVNKQANAGFGFKR